jgi:hypothetical protein
MSLTINFVDVGITNSSVARIVVYFTDTTNAVAFDVYIGSLEGYSSISLDVLPADMSPSGTNGQYKYVQFSPPNIGETYMVDIIAKSSLGNSSGSTIASASTVPTVLPNAPLTYLSFDYTFPGSGGGGGVPCFPAGVMIRTPGGEAPVETLKTGNLVITATGRVVPIRMHSYSLEATSKATAPYFIPANALGPKAPAKPLHLSPLHAFQVRPNVWWCAQQAAKVSSKIQQYAVGEPITYYHVECPNFLRDNLVADGVVVESFAGKQLTAAESRNLYKFHKEVGGYVRSAPAAVATAAM